MAAVRLEQETMTFEEPALPVDSTPRGMKAPGTRRMIAGSLFGALAAYLFQVVGTRSVGGPDAFAPIGLLWTAFFIIGTVVLVPLEQFFTRESSRGRAVLKRDLTPAVLFSGLAAALTAGFVLVVLDHFEGNPLYALQGALLAGLYGWMQVGKGVLAGHRRFAQYGAVLAGEGAVRLLAALLFVWISATASSLAWAMALAPLAVLLVRPWRVDRQLGEVERTPPSRFLGAYLVGSSASQILLAAAPLGVIALGGDAALVSVVFVTFTLYRAPLTLIYNLQGRILPLLVKMASSGDRVGINRLTRRVLAIGGALTLLAGVVGWLVGPQVVALLFGADYRPAQMFAALVAAGVMAASTTQVAGQALVASGATGTLAGAWVGGLVAALAVLFLASDGPDTIVAIAFLAGEVTAVVVVAVRILGGRRRRVEPASQF